MFIDFHTHAFPDKIASKAVDKLAHAAGALTKYQDGTIDGLRDAVKRLDGRAVLLPIATNPQQQRNVNDWAKAVARERIISFGSVHPWAEDALDELDRLKAMGVKGIKFHPEYQDFYVDDARVFPIYERAAGYGMITVFHAGMDLAYAPPCRCTPERLRTILPVFKGAPVVAAHFGGYMLWERVIEVLTGLPIYLDTSYSHGHIVKPFAQEIIRRHGAKKILFGTDSPWNTVEDEMAFIESLELHEAEKKMIFYENAAKLLGLGEEV